MFYIVTRFNINQSGQEAHSQQRYDDIKQAKKRYHSIIATDVDNDNYQYELVEIIDSTNGIAIASEIFENPVLEQNAE